MRVPAPDGWRRAKCRGTVLTRNDYDPFSDDEPVALQICNGDTVCPIRAECLEFALTNNCAHGVYGGTTEVQRRWLRKMWPLRSGKVPRSEWAFGIAPDDEQCLVDLGKTREELLEEVDD